MKSKTCTKCNSCPNPILTKISMRATILSNRLPNLFLGWPSIYEDFHLSFPFGLLFFLRRTFTIPKMAINNPAIPIIKQKR